jgi:hypothetical protein
MNSHGGNSLVDYSKQFLGVNENIFGITYPDSQIRWVSWVVGPNPTFSRLPNEPLIAHGTMTYRYNEKTGIKERTERINIKARIKGEPIDNSIMVFDTTPIIVNIIGAFYFVGDEVDGRRLNSLSDCNNACLIDMNETREIYCNIKGKDDRTATDCPTYFIMSMPFQVDVAAGNPYLPLFETPLTPGPHEGVTMNYCLIIKNLPQGVYLLRFGAYGRDGYRTDSAYQIRVSPTPVTDKRVPFIPDLGVEIED